MECDRPTAGWLWRLRRQLRRRRVLVVCSILSSFVVIQMLTSWFSDDWLDDKLPTHSAAMRASWSPPVGRHADTTLSLLASLRCARLSQRPSALFTVICRNRTSRIPTQTHLKPRDGNNTSVELFPSRSSPDVVVLRGVQTDKAYRGQTDSTSVTTKSLVSSTYNETTTDIRHQDAAVWRRHLLAVVNSNTTNSFSSLSDNNDTSYAVSDDVSSCQ